MNIILLTGGLASMTLGKLLIGLIATTSIIAAGMLIHFGIGVYNDTKSDVHYETSIEREVAETDEPTLSDIVEEFKALLPGIKQEIAANGISNTAKEFKREFEAAFTLSEEDSQKIKDIEAPSRSYKRSIELLILSGKPFEEAHEMTKVLGSKGLIGDFVELAEDVSSKKWSFRSYIIPVYEYLINGKELSSDIKLAAADSERFDSHCPMSESKYNELVRELSLIPSQIINDYDSQDGKLYFDSQGDISRIYYIYNADVMDEAIQRLENGATIENEIVGFLGKNGGNIIFISGQRGTLSHELGHFVDAGRLYSKSKEFNDIMMQDMQGFKKALTANEYFTENCVEFFAESFYYYILEPELLKENCEHVYNYIDNIVNNYKTIEERVEISTKTEGTDYFGMETSYVLEYMRTSSEEQVIDLDRIMQN